MHELNNPSSGRWIPALLVIVIVLALSWTPLSALAVEVTASDGEFEDRVAITWTKDENEVTRYYELYRCTGETTDSCVNIVKKDRDENREYSDVDAEPLVIYYYRVRVIYEWGSGDLSAFDSGYRAGVEVDDFGDSCNEAASIGENSSTAGTLESAGDKDYFRIDVTVAGLLTVGTLGNTDTAGRLKDSSCSDITSSGGGGQGSNFQVSAQVQPGTYFVEVSGESSSTGSYQLNSQLVPDDDYGNSCNDARQIDPNSQRSGSLEVGGDLDYFHIQVVSPGTITLNTSGGTDTYGTLKDASCATIAENDNRSGDGNFQIVAGLEPGDYYLEVRGANGGVTGDYQVQSQFSAGDDYGNVCENAASLGSNNSLSGVLENAGDHDVFAINVPQRGTLELSTAGDTDTYGYLLNANCEQIDLNDDSGEGRNFLIIAELGSGDYFIDVGGYADISVGAYEVTSTFVAAPDTGGSCESARSIGLNGSTIDEIETLGDHDFFRLDIGGAGMLNLRSVSDIDMLGTLRDGDCQVIVENDDGGDNLNFLIQANLNPGTYFLETRTFADAFTGPYTIESNFTSEDEYGGSCAEATTISPDSVTDGQIGSAGDHDFFRFELEFDTVMYMQTTGSTDTYGALRNADCGFMRRNDDGGENLNLRIATYLTAGVYYLDVSGYGEVSTGPYQLLMSTLDDGLGVDLNANPGMNDAWFNPETPGQGFFVTVFPQLQSVFVSWFTHETFLPDAGVTNKLGDPGHRWYTAFGRYYGNEAFLDIELTTGGLFNSDKAVEQTYPGTLYINFESCSRALIVYDLPNEGLSGSIPVSRALEDNVPVCEELGYYYGESIIDQQIAKASEKQATDPEPGPQGSEQPGIEVDPLTELNYGLNDAWLNTDWYGQGFFVTVFPETEGVFVSWFTFDDESPDAQTPYLVGAPGHRWFTAFGFYEGNRADMDLELTTNGLFNDPLEVEQGAAGTMSIQFDDCYNGKISYYLDQTGESGEIPVKRAYEDPGIISGCENPTSTE